MKTTQTKGRKNALNRQTTEYVNRLVNEKASEKRAALTKRIDDAQHLRGAGGQAPPDGRAYGESVRPSVLRGGPCGLCARLGNKKQEGKKMPDVKELTEEQLRNWVRDFAGTGWDLAAMAELRRRGLKV